MTKITTAVKTFFREYTTFLDQLFLFFIGLGLFSIIALLLINQWGFHFPEVSSFEFSVWSFLQTLLSCVLGFVFLLYGMYIRTTSPRASTFLWGIGLFFWAVLINFAVADALQSTPFPPIDQTLVKIDKWMGIDTPAIMLWTHHHPFIHRVFSIAYEVIILELFFIPIILAMLNARHALGVFFIAQFFAFFIGCAIYYFFPTMAPSGVFNSPYFTPAEHDTSLRFFEIHHYLKVAAAGDGGLISFPSFHVVWAILFTYVCLKNKIFFCVMVCVNSLLIASTVFLGWHYFVDVIGGIILAIISIYFGEWVYKQ